MSRQQPEEVVFCDPSPYFSAEEWKLLHEWQKELYRNVMKEIHQALLSLGPLIVTTVTSLRAKEKREMFQTENQASTRSNSSKSNLSSNVTITDSGALVGIKREEILNLNSPGSAEGRGVNSCLSTAPPNLNTEVCLKKEEEPASIFIDHLGEEAGQSGKGHDEETSTISEIKSQLNTGIKMAPGRTCSTSPSILSSQLLASSQSLCVEHPPICHLNRAETFMPPYKDVVGMHTEPRTFSTAMAPRLGVGNQYRPGRGRGRKAPPFTTGEMRALVLGIAPHYRQLYHTGAASNSVKRELWQEIRQRVASEGIVMRTIGQLKIKYRQMRRPVMQKMSQYWNTVPALTAGSPDSLGLTDMENLIACSVVPEAIDGVSDSDDRVLRLEDTQDQEILTDTEDSDAVEGDGSDFEEGAEEDTQSHGTGDISRCIPSVTSSAQGDRASEDLLPLDEDNDIHLLLQHV
ncbi:uncharacterized protein LOC144772886 isoform X2 [Lissotriton helveticus]